jgi:arsenite methyltransferase
MENHHLYPTLVAFDAIEWNPGWHLLDIGCGSGWASRLAAKKLHLGKVVGIDVSEKMVKLAGDLSAERANIETLHTDLPHSPFQEASFDVIHANEAIYYIVPVSEAIKKIYKLLKPGGHFIAIIDFYVENEASHIWAEQVDAPMELLSESDYIQLCRDAGFSTVNTERVLHPEATEEGDWQKTTGSLLLTAVK